MDNKYKIIECALELFNDKGYDGIGVQEICEKAGVTKPTLYHYFGSKLGLLESLLDYYYREFRGDFKEVCIYDGDLPVNLYKIAKVYFTFASRNKNCYLLVMSMLYSGIKSDSYKATREIRNEQFELLTELFKKAGDVNGNLNGRQKQFAATFLGALNSYLVYWFAIHKHQDENISDDQVFAVVHQFMHGIYT